MVRTAIFLVLLALVLLPAEAAPRRGDVQEAQGSGRVFRDCPLCPEMVVVPAGEFLMGSPESEKGRGKDEGPQHKVTIAQPFAVGKHEVTFAQWDACTAEGGGPTAIAGGNAGAAVGPGAGVGIGAGGVVVEGAATGAGTGAMAGVTAGTAAGGALGATAVAGGTKTASRDAGRAVGTAADCGLATSGRRLGAAGAFTSSLWVTKA